MERIDFGKDAARPSGAPDAGGSTARGSVFGGGSLMASLLRLVARVARTVEAEAYRRLRDLEWRADKGDGGERPGVPDRVRRAWSEPETRIH